MPNRPPPARRSRLWHRFGHCLPPARRLPWPVRRAASVVRGGGIIAYPTEAVWGLGCDPANAAAFGRLLALKGRGEHKGVILIAADLSQLAGYLAPIPRKLRQRLHAAWPHPVTWLLPAHGRCPPWLRGHHDTLAVRITRHAQSALLCQALGGPLVSTSANPSGAAPARTAGEVRRYFGRRVDYRLEGPTGGHARPSQIRDGRSGRVVRR